MKSLFKVLSIVLFSTLMFSCSQDDDDDIINGNNSNNNLKKGQVEIKGYPDKDNKMSFVATATKITIDWGDGSVDELTPNGVGCVFVHEYANQNLQTIKINTEAMTSMSLSSRNSVYNAKGTYNELRLGDCPDLKDLSCSYQNLTVLSIKSAPVLESLYCDYNQLTSLNVSGCPALIYLDCRNNQLTAEGLNSLFNSLHSNEVEYGGVVYISNNPGTNTCDRTIAENKGWSVWSSYHGDYYLHFP